MLPGTKELFVFVPPQHKGIHVVRSVLQAVLVQHSGTPGKAHTRQSIVLCYDHIAGFHPVDQRKVHTVSTLVKYQRLRTLTHLKNMDYWKISHAVWAASTMSRAVLKRVDTGSIPIRAQQIVVPVLAVGLCYGLESEAVSLIAKYILMFVSMRSAPDNVFFFYVWVTTDF